MPVRKYGPMAVGIIGVASVIAAAVVAESRLLGGDAPHPASGTDDGAVFASAAPGECLTWPESSPDAVSVVDCANQHRFEIAGSLQTAAGPSHQTDHQQCQAVVGQYLGVHYDPGGRFTVGVLWSPDTARQRTLCGLQLPGPDSQQVAFAGRVADLDQSKVWPAGTCLGVDARTNQSTDLPVDCATRHAVEVTGTATVAAASNGPAPAATDQEAFITRACTPTTDAYLSPVALSSTGLALAHVSIAPASWTAGTRQVACRIGAPDRTGGWATLVGSAKGALQINGQPHVPTTTRPAPPIPPASSAQVSTATRHGPPPGAATPPPAAPPPADAAPDGDNRDQPLGPPPGPVDGSAPVPPAPAPGPPPDAGN